MTLHDRRPGVTRRGFLKATGALAGAAALTAPFAHSAHASSAPDSLVRIGLLLPQSSIHPALGTNLAAGLKLGFQHARAAGGQGRATLAVQDIGIGVSAVADRARALINAGEVDLVVGLAGPDSLTELRPVLEQSGVPFLLCDAGANVLHPEEHGSYVVHNSLGYWQGNWALGEWAAANLGRKAFVVASFYESGYDSLRAFEAAFEAAGGNVVQTRVTHVPPDPVAWGPLFAAIRAAGPDFVFASYSGPQAADFVREYAAAGLAATIPLVGSAFLIDDAVLATLGEAAEGIRTCLSWAAGLDTPENQAFVTGYRAMTGRSPEAFAALGYDTAMLISQGLEAAAFTGPRGAVRVNPATNALETPLYLCEVHRGRNEVIATLPAVGARDPRLRALRTDVRTGWLNAYLSV